MISRYRYTVSELIPFIDWAYFYHAWQVKKDSDEGIELKREALQRLDGLATVTEAEALYLEVDARSEEDDIVLLPSAVRLPMLRQQRLGDNGFTLCLSDFIRSQGDTIGLFATTCGLKTDDTDPYESLMMQTLSTRLAEAAAEKLDQDVWHAAEGRKAGPGRPDPISIARGIRPAIGYPSLPDLSVVFLLDELLHMQDIGITLTENGAMNPPSSVAGFIIRHPHARYFSVGNITKEQFQDYVRRRGLSEDRMRQFLRAVYD